VADGYRRFEHSSPMFGIYPQQETLVPNYQSLQCHKPEDGSIGQNGKGKSRI